MASQCENEERISIFNLGVKFLNPAARSISKKNININLYRYKETEKLDKPDHVHLSEEGVKILEDGYKSLIKFNQECPLQIEVTNNKQEKGRKNQEQTGIKQFKLTNFKEAMNSTDEDIEIYQNKANSQSNLTTGVTHRKSNQTGPTQ